MTVPTSVATATINVTQPQEAYIPHRGEGGGGGGEQLNETLNTQHLDLDPNDGSCIASCTRLTASCVGVICTPHRMLMVMRILKAVTFSFLLLTIAADILYIIFVDFLSGVGDDGFRGMIVRFYGLGLAVLAILIELDVKSAVASFPALKGFIPRALLLLFIAVITNVTYQSNHNQSKSTYNQNRSLTAYYDDAVNATDSSSSSGGSSSSYSDNSKSSKYSFYRNDYSYNNNDDDVGQLFTPTQIENVPMSAVVFQMVTSWVLAACALCYLIMGLFCCDRFTAKAFVSKHDPVASTVLDSSSIGKPHYRAPLIATGEGYLA
jgi:hypothetical protein